MSAFAGKVAFVTGAGTGLGKQLAVNLAREGAAIAAVDLNPEPLKDLAQELPGTKVAWAVADVRDRRGLEDATVQLTKQLGPIDILIANAGIGIETSALQFRSADIEAQISVNLIGVANSVGAVLPAMIERRSGHLVAISSLASYRGLPRMLGYCASKAGVSSLMEGLRVELLPLGIAVTTICPGWIRTALTANINIPHPYMMELPFAAERIVKAIVHRQPYLAFPRKALRQVQLLKWLPAGLSDRLTLKVLRRLEGKESSNASR